EHVGSSISRIEEISNSNLDVETKMDELLKDSIKFWADHKDFFNIYFEQITTEMKIHPFKCHEEMKQRVNKSIENIIIEGQNKNIFDKTLDPKILTLSIRGMMIMPMLQMQLMDPSMKLNIEKIHHTIKQTIFKGIRNEA
ncbi:MAG: hypothetical protein AB7V50_08825, partial [Vampirovibrionia bacterium]